MYVERRSGAVLVKTRAEVAGLQQVRADGLPAAEYKGFATLNVNFVDSL